MKIKLLLFACFIVWLQGCDSDDDDNVRGEYQSGVLVANEGAFQKSTASVTHFNPETHSLTQNIFKNAAGLFAGDVLQSITLDGDRGYLVLNGSNAIEIVDHNTFKSVATFTDPELDKPRYVQVINGKAYISVWGPYDANFSLIDSYVLVVDTKSLAVVDKIDTDEGVENLLYDGNRLFASNWNYGGSHTLAVINPSANELVDQIELAEGPAGMVMDANNKLWVITTGTFQGNDGKLFRIDPANLTIEDVIELSLNPDTNLAITTDKKNLVYSDGNLIYKISIAETQAPTQPWIVASDVQELYALDINPGNGEVYVGDARDYSSPGKVFVYHEDGSFKESFESGISPTQFIFK
jgi:DNA-binding beta-propeller fold protein YncE